MAPWHPASPFAAIGLFVAPIMGPRRYGVELGLPTGGVVNARELVYLSVLANDIASVSNLALWSPQTNNAGGRRARGKFVT